MSSLEIIPTGVDAISFSQPKYISPAERILTDINARQVLETFMDGYVGTPDIFDRRNGGDRPRIAVEGRNGTEWNSAQELFTGYSNLGDLVHVRVEPQLSNTTDGYLVVIGDIETGDLYLPAIIGVEEVYIPNLGSQTVLYLDSPESTGLPTEYCHQIRILQRSQQIVYVPGPDRASSLLHPIEDLCQDVALTAHDSLGQCALSVVLDET